MTKPGCVKYRKSSLKINTMITKHKFAEHNKSPHKDSRKYVIEKT